MSTPEVARLYRARKRAERVAAGEFIHPQKNTPEVVTDLLRRRSIRDANGCLIWQGSRDNGGYGVVSVLGRPTKTHRAAWMVAHGPIPDGLFVCHSCDNPPCIEPTHLWLGTRADNMHDAYVKGRTTTPAGWNKGRPHSPETKAKIGARALGRKLGPHTPESIAKMAEARREWWQRRRAVT